MERVSGTNSVHDLIGMFEGWEKVQELAEHLSGVRAQLIDPQGKTISGRDSLPDFCRLIQSSKIGESRCRKCYEINALSPASVKRESTVFQCHAGLENVAFPISIDGIPAGAIACGRALNPHTRPDDRHFQALANELSVDFGEMEVAIGKLTAIETSEISAFAKLLKPFVDALGETIFRYFTLIEKSEDLIVAAKESDTMMSVDRLTGLFNRRYFDTRIESEVSRSNRYGHSIALVLLDIDCFDDRINSYGLITRDIVLKEIGAVLLQTARQTEVVVRFDEDRFGVIMPECDHEQSFRFAERVRKAIAVSAFGKDAGLDITLTMSIGVAALREEATVEKLVERAEQVLSQAKNDGGNKIRLAPTPGSIPETGKTPHVYIPNQPKKRRVVVTGLGLITPIGIGKDVFWSSMKAGKCGTDLIQTFDRSLVQSKIAAEVIDFDAADHMPAKEVRRMDRFAQFAVAASRMAFDDAKFSDFDATRMGVRLGTNIGGIGYAEDQYNVLLEKGPRALSPFLAIAFSIGSSSSQVSLSIGAKGSSLTVAGECTSGASAIASAYDEIVYNRADIMLAGGAEAPIRPIFMSSLETIRLLSLTNDEPSKASRPFDLNRDGIVIGEGSAMLVMEDLEHALRRDARIYAEILSYGMTCDSFHMVRPDPEGFEAGRAMNIALQNANLKPSDIGYVNMHGSSTQLNDAIETRTIKNVFGDHASVLPVSGTKSMTGHAIGAVSAMECAATTLALMDGFLPPTMNYETPDPDCDLDYVANAGRKSDISFAMSNSFGFGGKNTILTLGKFHEKLRS
jgi:3-oxoacyl-[acyl-carrier-protein] synthase II